MRIPSRIIRLDITGLVSRGSSGLAMRAVEHLWSLQTGRSVYLNGTIWQLFQVLDFESQSLLNNFDLYSPRIGHRAPG